MFLFRIKMMVAFFALITLALLTLPPEVGAQVDVVAPASSNTYNITGTTPSELFATDTTDLKGLNLPKGRTCFLAGLTSSSSVGAGYFTVIDSTYPETYGGEVFAHSEQGKQWVRVDYLTKKIVNVQDFGAKGDNSTDDKTAMRNAMLFGSGYSSIELPNLNYYLSGSVTIPSNRKVYSNGKATVRHRYFMLDSLTKNVTIEGITFDGDVDPSTWMYGIRLKYGGMKKIIIRKCKFKNNAIITQDYISGMSPSDSILIEECTFEDSASSTLANVSAIQLNGFSHVEIKNCKFKVYNFAQAIKVANQCGEVIIRNCEFKGAPSEELVDAYSSMGPITFKDNKIRLSGGAIFSSKPSGTAGNFGYPYKVTVSNNKIWYTGNSSNLLYFSGSYGLSFDDDYQQEVDFTENKFYFDSLTTAMRVVGADIANISENQFSSETNSDGYAIYLDCIKYLDLSHNIIGSGNIIGYPTSTPSGDVYPTSYTGFWNITGNTVVSNASNEAPIYIYNQDINSISITSNILNVASNQIGYAVRIRECSLNFLTVLANPLVATGGGYDQYARVNLTNTTANHLNIDNFGQNIINVKDFGAVGDGITDDKNAIDNADNMASYGNGYVDLVGLTYKYIGTFSPTNKFCNGKIVADNGTFEYGAIGSNYIRTVGSNSNSTSIGGIYNDVNSSVASSFIHGGNSTYHNIIGKEYSYNTFEGDGTTTTFNITTTFTVNDESWNNIHVLLIRESDGASWWQTEGSDYSVSGYGTSTITIMMDTPPAVGYLLEVSIYSTENDASSNPTLQTTIGYDNVNNAIASHVISMHSMNFNGSGHNAILGGSFHRIGGYHDVILGGKWNRIGITNTSAFGSMTGGQANRIEGSLSFAYGEVNTISGDKAFAFGSGNYVEYDKAFAFGIKGKPLAAGEYTQADGDASDSRVGMRQYRRILATTETSDGTTAYLRTVSGATSIPIPDSSAAYLKVDVTALRDDHTQAQTWSGEFLITRDAAGTPKINGSTSDVALTSVYSIGSPSWNAAVRGLGNNLTIRVTGAASTNIRWIGKIELTQVVY